MARSKTYRLSLLFILLITLIANVQSAPSQDQVHMPVPGYNQHKWYSGYLTFNTGKFHYVFFESQRDPDNDPVVLWLNGGPGCSSLIGMVNQNGPFTFKEGTTNFQINKYSWNMKANILYIESPGGVGFSTGTRNNTYNDQTTTQDNLMAVIKFFQKFPNLKKNQFYISGQSYAGIYVPYLALQITNYNKLPNKAFAINLKGIMVGNACTDPRQCYEPGDSLSIYQYQFLYEHGFLTQSEIDDMKATCIMGYTSRACVQVRQRLDKNLSANKISLMNIYLKCFSSPSQQLLSKSQRPKYKITQSGRRQNLQQWPNCDDQVGITEFFNEPLIHNYLHVDPIHYQMCSDQVETKYTMNANASYWVYPLLIKQNLRIWVYSGDFDANVPILGTLTWLKRFREQFHLPIHEPWREWWVPGLHTHEDQVGGMTWQLRGLTFASVKAAGHMVPKDDKKAASVLFNSFITGTELPFKSQQ